MKKSPLVFILIILLFSLQIHAQTWSALTRLTWNSGLSGRPWVEADSGTGIHAIWRDDTPGNAEIFFKHSTDGGATWSAIKRMTWNSGDSFGSVIIANSGTGIHITWEDDTPGNREIFYKGSTDSGVTWSAPKRLTWNAGTSTFSNIASDSANGIHVVWQDLTPGNAEIFYKNRK